MEKVATAAKIKTYQPYHAAMGNLLARGVVGSQSLR